jgi:hypothetical protein
MFVSGQGQPLSLANLYRNGQAFLLLSGPSAKQLDLSLLTRRGCYVMGVNNSPALVRCNSMIYVDRAWKIHDAIWLDPAAMKFVPQTQLDCGIRRQTPNGPAYPAAPIVAGTLPGVVGYARNDHFRPAVWIEEASVNWGHNDVRGGTYPYCKDVLFAALKVLYVLGFRTIYLLGCDFSMRADRPYAFDVALGQHHAEWYEHANNSIYKKMAQMLADLKPHFDSAGLKIFNCNQKSGLTVFESCSYNAAIGAASGGIQQGLLDARGWYELND